MWPSAGLVKLVFLFNYWDTSSGVQGSVLVELKEQNGVHEIKPRAGVCKAIYCSALLLCDTILLLQLENCVLVQLELFK